VYFTEVHGTVTRVGRLPFKGAPEILGTVDGIATGIHLNATGTHFGFTWEKPDQPPEAHISPVDRFEPIPVSTVNAKLSKADFGKTEVIRWKSKDGLEIEGLLTYPANYEKGKRYPLLLNVHGGPMGVFTQTYVASPGLYPIATFSARGYAVLRPNPRGSSGYGKKFRYANYNDWGGGDYQDLMTGVDHVIKMGVADEKRLGVMGWSYGGFMTSWIITQNQRFKAASVGAGVTNLMSFTGTADIPSFLPDYFGGEFWDKLDTYKKHSAMFNIKGVKTPTLVQHGEKDERVPLSQGLELYNALKRQGCTTKMVIYPRTPHGIEEPRLLVDCMERNLEWFGMYVK
jgi:dipeptidyl aminopeptidase/acylaminoacyl peptidase